MRFCQVDSQKNRNFCQKTLGGLRKIYNFAAVLVKDQVAMNNGCKRFHKFWFLVLENPGLGWGFLVIGKSVDTRLTRWGQI